MGEETHIKQAHGGQDHSQSGGGSLEAHALTPGLYVGARGLRSGPPAFAANILTKPPPCPLLEIVLRTKSSDSI